MEDQEVLCCSEEDLKQKEVAGLVGPEECLSKGCLLSYFFVAQQSRVCLGRFVPAVSNQGRL
jgi:hypothetical protein